MRGLVNDYLTIYVRIILFFLMLLKIIFFLIFSLDCSFLVRKKETDIYDEFSFLLNLFISSKKIFFNL